jgi:hypothetical protein
LSVRLSYPPKRLKRLEPSIFGTAALVFRWAGYDELTVAEVQAVLSEGDDEQARKTRSYERAHKNRAGVLNATEREHSNA